MVYGQDIRRDWYIDEMEELHEDWNFKHPGIFGKVYDETYDKMVFKEKKLEKKLRAWEFKSGEIILNKMQLATMNLGIYSFIRPDRKRIVNLTVSAEGNLGKTFIQSKLAEMWPSVCIQYDWTNQFKNLTCALQKKPELAMLFLDIARDKQFIDMQTAEKLKNEHVLCEKYDSKELVLPNLSVNICANDMPNVVTLSSDRWNVLMAYQWKGELKNVFISEQNPFFRPWIYREYQFALQVRNENGMQPRPQTPCQRTTGPYELHPKSLTGCWCKDLTDEQMDGLDDTEFIKNMIEENGGKWYTVPPSEQEIKIIHKQKEQEKLDRMMAEADEEEDYLPSAQPVPETPNQPIRNDVLPEVIQNRRTQRSSVIQAPIRREIFPSQQVSVIQSGSIPPAEVSVIQSGPVPPTDVIQEALNELEQWQGQPINMEDFSMFDEFDADIQYRESQQQQQQQEIDPNDFATNRDIMYLHQL